MSDIQREIARRRTFAIISHPDAGKTTLTEKLLLYGGAIALAGAVKGKASARHAVSDWMELEKQRGISITSSVMQFAYNGCCINILDTPGHQDFSEDTYRTLMAADSAVMVIDGAKGIEPQTRKLFRVCARRGIPIFTFINKLDRDIRDPFDLLDELEREFSIGAYPVNWPIGSGVSFRGVFDRARREILTYERADSHAGREKIEAIPVELGDDARLFELLGREQTARLREEVELLDGAGYDFSLSRVREGKLTPVFFGSALNNFGVEPFLREFLAMTMPPLPHLSGERQVAPDEEGFSAFVFKIQANMNRAHRDRIAFFRICSGCFMREREYLHVQSGKVARLSRPLTMMANDRAGIDRAFAGDVIGVFDPGVFAIGDTVCEPSMDVRYGGIPTFAPEHFAQIEQKDALRRKQFAQGLREIAEEGAIQIFTQPGGGLERVTVGVVGPLQFDVLAARMESEYGVTYHRTDLPHTIIRRLPEGARVDTLNLAESTLHLADTRGREYLLFAGEWSLRWALEKNKDLTLEEFDEQ